MVRLSGVSGGLAPPFLSRRHLDPSPDSFRLPDLCDHFDVDFDDHHNAEADATACAQVALCLLRDRGVTTPDDLCSSLRLKPGLWGPADVRFRSPRDRHGGQSSTVTAQPSPDADPEHPLYGTRLVFTGTLARWRRADAAEAAAACGAKVVAAVSRKTSYLVVGVLDRGGALSTKQRKAQEVIETGGGLQVITEYEFDRLLGEVT